MSNVYGRYNWPAETSYLYVFETRHFMLLLKHVACHTTPKSVTVCQSRVVEDSEELDDG